MKKSLLLPVLLFFMASTYGQTIQITEMTATATTGGINVNLKTISFNGAAFLDYAYTITGNTVNVSACFSFNMTLPVLTFENNLFVPVAAPGNYDVVVTVYNSSSPENCDYFSSGGSASATVLSLADTGLEASRVAFYPNPTAGIAALPADAETIDAVLIYDYTGKLVRQLDDNPREIDLAGLRKGIYLVKVKMANRTFVQRIVKK